MKHIVVDLEMNPIKYGHEARRIGTNEIIEIGAVMLDDDLSEVAAFKTFVKPELNDGIAKKITKLTGITDDMVKNAPDFNTALKMFISWCNGTGDEVIVHAWSESDYDQIKKEMEIKFYECTAEERNILDKKWDDFQHQFDSHLGFERQLSLSTALNMAGIDFMGRAHDALDDARNTAELLQVFSDTELFEKTLAKIKEVMTPTDIGCSLGSMFDFSAFLSA